ncbi:E3 ubiquitin-protein ligase RNF133 [Heterocephalus glaber]|uniref:E3 ubiquitin-protein ligase RNF133 n=1 Tax=Heterocephalus glaber TaxID=10181 RepID=G5B3R7_HETGA|nr:E3 ubiquitin-protein ligase RNF133 [Heterocephalus glaber]
MNQENKSCFFRLLVIFTFLPKSTPSFLIDAYVTATYYNETSNYTTTETCECGVYGLASPVAKAVGVVGIPKNNNYQACDYNTEFTNTKKPWIALIERGNCTFSEKIQTAGRRNADAVVIYNAPETGNQTIQMANFDLHLEGPKASGGRQKIFTGEMKDFCHQAEGSTLEPGSDVHGEDQSSLTKTAAIPSDSESRAPPPTRTAKFASGKPSPASFS